MSEIDSAADAALMLCTSTSDCTRSKDCSVVTICDSWNHPSGKNGRSTRSMAREVRTSESDVPISRRRNVPGMNPNPEDLARKSTESGMKSFSEAPWRPASDTAVARITESPVRATTAPDARRAILPVENVVVAVVVVAAPLSAETDVSRGRALEEEEEEVSPRQVWPAEKRRLRLCRRRRNMLQFFRFFSIAIIKARPHTQSPAPE